MLGMNGLRLDFVEREVTLLGQSQCRRGIM